MFAHSHVHNLYTPSRVKVLALAAIVSRVKTAMWQHHVLVLDLWRFLDEDGDGKLSCSELLSGLKSIGLRNLTQAQVYTLVRALDLNGDGWVEKPEFEAVFSDAELEAELQLLEERSERKTTQLDKLDRVSSIEV